MLLKDKVIIITGGASGIGESSCTVFAREGGKIILADISEEQGNKVIQKITQNNGEATFVKTDVSKPEECERLVKETLKKYKRLDAAFNNAGIGGESNATADYSIEGWQKVIEVNLNSVFYCMKYQIPAMLANGGGSILNMASILGSVGFASAPAYVASKHAIVGLTKTMALEYAVKRIRVNAIGPAFINTPLLSSIDAASLEYIKSKHPIGRLGEPEEVAEMALWLLSDKASFVTGSYFPVDGGYLAQ